MVSLISSTIAVSAGFMTYLAIPFIASGLPVDYRYRIGTFYFKLEARALKQFTFVRRVLSGYDILPIEVDNEQKLLKATLDSSRNPMSEDSQYPFKDPDSRIKRLYNKPVALNYEEVPAAVDAELAELGYWTEEKENNDGLYRGEGADAVVDIFLPVDDGLHLIDPIDCYNIIPNSVDPENVKTTEKLTVARHDKYGLPVDMTNMLTGLMAYFAGWGSVMGMKFFDEKFIGGGGGGGSPIDNPVGNVTIIIDPTPVFDVVMALW